MTILQEREQRGIELGMELARKEEKRNLAKNMILDGEPIEKIIRYTRFDMKDIEKLKKEIFKN